MQKKHIVYSNMVTYVEVMCMALTGVSIYRCFHCRCLSIVDIHRGPMPHNSLPHANVVSNKVEVQAIKVQ